MGSGDDGGTQRVVGTTEYLAGLVDAYRRDGYVVARGLLTPDEAAALRAETHALIDRLAVGDDPTWGSARELGEPALQLRHCHDVQLYSAAFSRLLVDERFTSVAAALIGSPNVQLHHTKAFVKPPERGAPFPLHQDHPYFPHVSHTVAAAILHFDDAPEEKGCVRVVTGSHRLGPLAHDPAGSWHLPLDEWPLASAVAVPAKAGDVVFFSYLTVHGSGINRSNEPRTTLLVQFHDPADRPVDGSNLALGRGLMLRGVAPTAVARADLAAVSLEQQSADGAQ